MSLWSKPRSKWLLGIPIGGFLAFVVGMVALGGFHWGMSYTNSNEFCYGCHIGMDTIVEEYQESIHFNNSKGVIAATCGDCHVPREFIPKMALKIGATADIFHKLTGKITLENFESEHRPRLAEKITNQFIENKSKQCRYCHDVERMDFEEQSRSAARRHQTMEERGKSCIDCHAGIAHKLPEEPEEEVEE
ncbi:NapC/NirT family cytochrome c [Vibrio sp.]|uniref:NapC/NirT family cytochrome c n=1 Tax=Vibrio sp. TaxID=678 RepID=UPI003D12B208